MLLQTIIGASTASHYLFHDVIGSLVRTTTAAGSVETLLDYAPFGARRTPDDPTGTAAASPALTGGTISRLTGGKFANGAMTATMQFAFNQLGQRMRWETRAITAGKLRELNLFGSDSPPLAA